MVTVNQTLTSIALSPSGATVAPGGQAQFAAVDEDQFGAALATQPAVTWSISGGIGTINSSGLFVAGSAQLTGAVTAASSTGSASAVVAVSSLPSPVAWYPCTEGSGTTVHDASGNGFNGTISSSGATWVTSRAPPGSGGALAFSSGSVNLGSPAGLNVTGLITLSAWIDPISSSGSYQDIVGRGYTTNPDAETMLRVNGGDYQVVAWNGTNYEASAAVPASDLNTWVQLVGVYDGTDWLLYRDGALLASAASTVGALPVAANWMIGSSGIATDTRYFNGSIGDVRIYNVALSASQVATLYDSYYPPTVATPAAASPALVTATSTVLSALGASVAGASSLTYTWATTGTPPAPVTFSANGTNAAASTTATFTKAGTYAFQVTITDALGRTVTSSVNVTVNQTLASITVSPSPVSLGGQSTQQFTATGFDQFGTALATQPSFTWSTASGATNVGTISATGLLTAANLSVTGAVTATSGGISGSGTVTVTGTSPTIAIGAPSTSYVAGGPVTYAVTYTDPNFNSSNLVTGDITLNKTGNASGTLSVTGSGLSYTVTLSNVTGNGSLGISIAAGTASDKDGNLAPAAGPSAVVTVNNVAPTISISGPSASLTAGGPVAYTVTYADANFNTSTLTASNITLNATGTAAGTVSVSGSGLTRTVTLSGITGNGTLGISIAAGTASDLAGNLAPAAGPSATFIVDNTPPTVTIGSPSESYTATAPISYTVSYADPYFSASSLTASSITLNKTGTASGTLSVTGSGLSYTVTIGGISGNGTLGISIAAGTATDLVGNLAPASGPSATFTVNNVAPTISIGGPSAAYAAGGPVTYTVTYADANFNTSTLVPANITLNETGTASGTLSVSGSGLTRTVTIGGITGNGSLGISIAAGTASDLAGNLAPAAGPSTTFIVDNVPPTISISQPTRSYTTTTTVVYTVNYADANFSASTLTSSNVTLNETGTANGVVFVSGVGLTRTVLIEDITGNGSLGISIAAGTASDMAGNMAPAAGTQRDLRRGQYAADRHDQFALGIVYDRRIDRLHGYLCRCELRFQQSGGVGHHARRDGNRQRHAERFRLGPELHGGYRRHYGRWHAGDFDRRRHRHMTWQATWPWPPGPARASRSTPPVPRWRRPPAPRPTPSPARRPRLPCWGRTSPRASQV